MRFGEGLDFGINSRLQHPTSSFMDDFIKGTATIEGLPKGEHFRVERFGDWHVGLVCRSLVNGVSLCPRWAVEVVRLPQQEITSTGYAAFYQSFKKHDF